MGLYVVAQERCWNFNSEAAWLLFLLLTQKKANFNFPTAPGFRFASNYIINYIVYLLTRKIFQKKKVIMPGKCQGWILRKSINPLKSETRLNFLFPNTWGTFHECGSTPQERDKLFFQGTNTFTTKKTIWWTFIIYVLCSEMVESGLDFRDMCDPYFG